MPLTEEAVSALRTTVERACYDHRKSLPGATVVVIGKDGKELFAHSAGRRGLASCDDMAVDNVYWIASCTKMITGVAVMQLVEKGVLELDNEEQIENLCPELKTLKVLKHGGEMEEKKKPITLRMLLSHTAGFGYSFFNERLRDWGLPAGLDEFSGRFQDMNSPLLFQPGEGWEYGVNIDWAGIALERATGLSLNDYMQNNILEPLGLKTMSMFPTEEMKSKLAYMHHRRDDGTLVPRDHLLRLPLKVQTQEEKAACLNSGGAGMFAKPGEYCKILAVLLNDGTCPTTGAQILKPETVAEMFTNQIPSFPNASRQFIPAAKPDLTNPIPELYHVVGDPPQGWGLTFMLPNGGPTGRSRSTGHWAGLSNCWWWCDRENGVAGIVCTQILPFADPQVLKLWADVETETYVGLHKASQKE